MAVSETDLPSTAPITEEEALRLQEICQEAVVAAGLDFSISLGATERYPSNFATLYAYKMTEEE